MTRFDHAVPTIEGRASWVVALAALAITAVSYGSPLVAVVALKPMAAEFGNERAVPSLANSLVWLGSGLGAIPMTVVAERFGVRATVAFGGIMIAAGFLLSSLGGVWLIYAAHGLLVGVLGTGAIHALLLTYVSRWFDRHRGTALALIASGQYVGGAFWPLVLTDATARIGWRATMMLFAGVALSAIVALAVTFLRPPPEAAPIETDGAAASAATIGMAPATVLALLSAAAFLCCVPMAMPPAHLIALCGDLGIAPTHGAVMLSVLLGAAFVSRQFWGWLSDRIGGLSTVLAASACQAAAMACFLLTLDEFGLFAVSLAFGLGFSGIIPAYILAIRELFPAARAGRNVSILYLCSILGMSGGGYLAGVVYDRVGFYGPAFAAGVAFNIANLLVVGLLVLRQGRAQAASGFKRN